MSDNHSEEERTDQPTVGIGLWLWRWFWRVTLVVSLAYAWYCFYVPNNEIAWADDYSSAQAMAAESDQPMVMFFTGKWCVPCRIMKRTVWADEEVESIVNAGFTPLLIDVSEPGESTDTAVRYEVGVTPTTIVADSEGNVLEYVQGAMDKSEFIALLERASL